MLDIEVLDRWGTQLYETLSRGARLLAAGNGGSAAEAQHLTAELVGRFGRDRQPFSALALHADSSSVTAIANDYSYAKVFARQVEAHGRAGDVLILLSASGNSPNVLAAAEAARARAMTVWALTGPRPNRLADLCDEAVAATGDTPVIQELHLTAVHLICESFERALAAVDAAAQHPAVPDSPPAAVDGAVPTPAPASGVPVVIQRRPLSRGRPRPPRRHGSASRILVVGDTLLDRDVSGRTERLSPEAPVPVVDSMTTSTRPGGAGLAAVFAARLGKEVTLMTALADDADGHDLRRLLEVAGVQVIDLGLAGATPVKTRIRTGNRSLLMLDEAPVPGAVLRPVPAEARLLAGETDAVVVADYGRNMTAAASVRDLLGEAAARVPVVWDPHPRGSEPVPGVRVATPNTREAAHAVQSISGSRLGADVDRARELLRRWPVAGIAVTLGHRGAALVEDPELPPLVIPAAWDGSPGEDTCGAGDYFAVKAAALLADGALLSEAVAGAVAAATAYVVAGGPRILDTASHPATTSPVDGLDFARRVRAEGGLVVATGGCFDLLHPGHVALLEQARMIGDCLIVCLNSDESVARLKGPSRPVVSLPDRALVLQALQSVDAVAVFDEDTPLRLLDELRPDIFVKGGDYSNTAIPEAALVRSWGGQVVTVPYLDGRSTTSLITRAVNGLAL